MPYGKSNGRYLGEIFSFDDPLKGQPKGYVEREREAKKEYWEAKNAEQAQEIRQNMQRREEEAYRDWKLSRYSTTPKEEPKKQVSSGLYQDRCTSSDYYSSGCYSRQAFFSPYSNYHWTARPEVFEEIRRAADVAAAEDAAAKARAAEAAAKEAAKKAAAKMYKAKAKDAAEAAEGAAKAAEAAAEAAVKAAKVAANATANAAEEQMIKEGVQELLHDYRGRKHGCSIL